MIKYSDFGDFNNFGLSKQYFTAVQKWRLYGYSNSLYSLGKTIRAFMDFPLPDKRE